MLIGYEIFGNDNNSYMTGSCEKLMPELKFLPKCKKCGYRTDYRYTDKDFIQKRKSLDFSSTYDGIIIVSLKFKEFCIRNRYDNIEFIDLPKAPTFYQFYINGNVLNYEARIKEKFCEACKQFESVVGPTFKSLEMQLLENGFYQSDLWFGSGNEKSPIIIIAPEVKYKIERERFRNIFFDKIEINN